MGHQSKADLYQRTIDSYRANRYSHSYSAESGVVFQAENCLGLAAVTCWPRGGARDDISPRQFRSGAFSLCQTLTNYLAGAGLLVLHFEASYVD